MESATSYLDHSAAGEIGQPLSLHGVLNINKPDGWTSHDVVQKIRSILGIQKVGHAGTLDPHATGVLPILIGKATKIAQYLVGWEKEYAAVLQLGQRTDTQDSWGEVLENMPVEALTDLQVRTVFNTFQGPVQQVPPMYSAVKFRGQPLYKKARRGQIVERQPKTVTIHELEIQKLEIPEVSFRIICSKGTYVRTLCADIGDVLQVGGHLKWLQRRRVGALHVDHALELTSLTRDLDNSGLKRAFWGMDQALEAFPAVEVDGDDARKVLHGNAVPWTRLSQQGLPTMVEGENKKIRVKHKDGKLLALGYGPVLQCGRGGPVLAIETVLA